MQPRSRRAVIVLDALGLAALAALFVLWCVRTPGLSVPGGIAAGAGMLRHAVGPAAERQEYERQQYVEQSGFHFGHGFGFRVQSNGFSPKVAILIYEEEVVGDGAPSDLLRIDVAHRHGVDRQSRDRADTQLLGQVAAVRDDAAGVCD